MLPDRRVSKPRMNAPFASTNVYDTAILTEKLGLRDHPLFLQWCQKQQPMGLMAILPLEMLEMLFIYVPQADKIAEIFTGISRSPAAQLFE